MQNRNDNECLKWSLRAALFPGLRNPQRTTSYPTNDGINYEGIDFPIKQLDKLEHRLTIPCLCGVLCNCNSRIG